MFKYNENNTSNT